MNDRERGEVRRHQVSWQFSQFLHGEQGALMCASKIVNTVPTIDAKFYAATQVIDEARHVEVFGRYLHEKLDLVYPLNANLRSLLDDALTDSRWDMTYLAMQVLIEGLALAAFSLIRNNATDPLAKSINAYVMQDEARHVMFGRLALRDYYPQLTEAERDEREEFCVDACYRMRDRFLGEEIWERLGLPVAEVVDVVEHAELQAVPRLSLHAHRAGAARHRPVGTEDPRRVRRHGRARVRRRRHRPARGRGRGDRRNDRRRAHAGHPHGPRPPPATDRTRCAQLRRSRTPCTYARGPCRGTQIR